MNGRPGADVQQFGPAVLLQGQAVLDVRSMIVRGIRAAQRSDGIAPPPRLLALVDALTAAVQMSPQRPNDVAGQGNKSDLWQTEDKIDSHEAAALLGIGVRQVQRIATSIGGQRIGRTWLFNRHDVQTYRNEDR